MEEQRIRGIIPPVTTPFDASGDLDEGALAGQCRWLLDRGVHGVTVAGSTGEGHTLSGEEARRAAAAAMQAVDGRAPVIAGIIANSTREVVHRGQALAGLGVAALQITPVHYLFRPDDDAMLEFYRAAAEQTGLPVIIYNVVVLQQRGNVPLRPYLAYTGDPVAQRLLRLRQKKRPADGGLQPDAVAVGDFVDRAIAEPSQRRLEQFRALARNAGDFIDPFGDQPVPTQRGLQGDVGWPVDQRRQYQGIHRRRSARQRGSHVQSLSDPHHIAVAAQIAQLVARRAIARKPVHGELVVERMIEG